MSRTLEEIAEQVHTDIDEELCASPGCETCAIILAALHKAVAQERAALREEWLIPDRLCLSCSEHVRAWLDARDKP